jgi:peptide deformylase
VATRHVLEIGHPLLWEKCPEVPAAGMATVVQDLADTLAVFRERHGFGRGIAAPQIGVSARIIFIRMRPFGFAGALINPRVEWESPDRFHLWDDCFSLPNLMVRVERARKVRVRYLDEQAQGQVLEAEGDLSELLQHEIDHLDGILATQRAVSPHAFSTRTEWERRYRLPA